MPNWCANNLTIEHEDPAMVDRFVKAYNEGRTCNDFIPKPENLGDSWFDWCIEHWGTKWDIGCNNNEEHGLKPTRVGNQVTVSFDSAWSPPIKLYEELDKLGFMVDATYFEPGMAYCGIWHDGDDLYTDYGDNKGTIPVRIWEDYNLEEFFEDQEETA